MSRGTSYDQSAGVGGELSYLRARRTHLRRVEKHLCELRVERELGHHRAQLGEVAVVVERAEVVEELESAHQRLGRGRVHKVEMDQVVDACASGRELGRDNDSIGRPQQEQRAPSFLSWRTTVPRLERRISG